MKNQSLFAFLAGAAIGATIALLVAPDSGKNTREKLAGKFREGRDRLREMAGEGVERAREAMSEGRHKVRETVEKATKTVKE